MGIEKVPFVSVFKENILIVKLMPQMRVRGSRPGIVPTAGLGSAFSTAMLLEVLCTHGTGAGSKTSTGLL